MRKLLLPLFAVLLFAALANADDWSKTYDLTGKPELRVEASDATVRIEPWDQDKIEAHVMTRGWHIGAGGGGNLEIVEHQQGNAVSIELREHHHFLIGVDTHHTELDIHMPRAATMNVKTGDGPITARGFQGELDFTSGDGRLDLEDLDGSLRAKTGDGSMRASGRFDLLDLQTGDGGVECEVRSGSRIGEPWEVRTSDGSVRLRLPADLAADVDLHTGDGHITTDLPINVQGSFSSNSLRGKINGGGQPLVIHTGDGSITLSKS